jgi:hypothetical protein
MREGDTNMRTTLAKIAVVAVLAVMPAGAALAAQNDSVSIEELAAKLASTPEEHQTVASYYRGKAEEARAEAQRHRTMAATYGGGKYVEKKNMEKHCAGLTATYEALAKDYEALAADHEAAGKETK